MGKKSVSKNYIYNMFYQILALLLPLITTPYLARVLGAEAIGIYSYTLSIVTYFILFGTLGVAMYGQREIAYVQDKKVERSIKFWEILLLKFFTMFISMTVFGLTFCMKNEYVIYYRLLVVELVSQAIDISWFFQGMEEFKKTVVRNSVVKLLFCICVFIFVKSRSDLVKYILIITVSNLIGNLSMWLYLPKYLSKVKINNLNVFKHLKPIFSLFVPQIAVQVYTVLDKTMIGKMVLDKSEVGYYEQSQKVVKILLTVVTSLGTVMIPRMASTFAKGDKEQLKKYMYNSFRFTFFIAFPIIFGLIAVAKNFVPLFFGEGYNSVIYLMIIISPIILFIGMSNIIGSQYLLPTKKQKEYTISVIIGACINFVLNLIFIYLFHALGASITTVVAELSVVIVQAYFIRKEFNLLEILKLGWKNLLSAIIMFLGIIWIQLMPLSPILCIMLQIIFGIIIYMVLSIIFKDELVKLIFEKFKSRMSIVEKMYRIIWKEN